MQRFNFLIAIGLAIVVYDAWISILLMRLDQYDDSQKYRQLLLIWLVPVLGAVIVHIMMWADGRPPYKSEKGYTEPGDNAS